MDRSGREAAARQVKGCLPAVIDPGRQHQPPLADYLAPEMESIGRRPKIKDRQIRPRMVGRSGHRQDLLAAAFRSIDGRSCAALHRYRYRGSRKISWLDPKRDQLSFDTVYSTGSTRRWRATQWLQDIHQFGVHELVAANHMTRQQRIVVAGHAADAAARLAHNDLARCHIPGLKISFPIAVETPGCDKGSLQGGSATP